MLGCFRTGMGPETSIPVRPRFLNARPFDFDTIGDAAAVHSNRTSRSSSKVTKRPRSQPSSRSPQAERSIQRWLICASLWWSCRCASCCGNDDGRTPWPLPFRTQLGTLLICLWSQIGKSHEVRHRATATHGFQSPRKMGRHGRPMLARTQLERAANNYLGIRYRQRRGHFTRGLCHRMSSTYREA